ncbi:MAG: adenosylcobinamide-phosphate synthase CbiB [Chlorobium sp.]|uniref:adenosylcobinamide-phosphate synthase CbiB n=1 Tax=Chlorobium sp. TaxID=1095 RepID=UPI002F3FFB5A
MGTPEYMLAAAFLCDLLFGDPRWMPHPVRAIAQLAHGAEKVLRISGLPLRIAGVLCVFVVVGGTAGAAWLVIDTAGRLHPAMGAIAGVYLLYTAFAVKDLGDHARAVGDALSAGDLTLARLKVSWMVGRDTAGLTEDGVALAAAESVAENTVDGVTAPLFYALLFGPVGALAYKAVNTLDSSFGYMNERYREFGWASAKLDDLANWLPARLTVLAIAVAAFIRRLRFFDIFEAVQQGARLHASPNAGYPEAAFAGALGVTFGGTRSYGGVVRDVPLLGLRRETCSAVTVMNGVSLMRLTAFVFLAAGTGLRLLFQLFM